MRAKVAVSFIALLLATILMVVLNTPQVVSAGGGGGGPLTPLPNVTWTFTDNIAGCPAGDSVASGHPARLRFLVTYHDANDSPKLVPPESVWVTFATPSGSNVQVNDQVPSKIYADDSTHAGGAYISFPSVSGCGQLNVTCI